MDLSRIEMFKGLSKVELARILGLMDRQAEAPGKRLFRQGERGDSMFLIEQGQVQLYSETPEGESRPLVLLGEGATLGEMALLTGEPRSATAVAASDVVLYRIDSDIFEKLIGENTALSAYFIRLLSQRLVQTNDRLQASKEAKARLVREAADRLPQPLSEALAAGALLPFLDMNLLEALLGLDWSELRETYREPLAEFVRPIAGPEGERGVELHPTVKPLLAERYLERHSERERAHWLRQAVEYWMGRGRWEAAAAVYMEQEDWESALNVAEWRFAAAEREAAAEAAEAAESAESAIGERDAAGLELFDRCPTELLASRFPVLAAYLSHCAASRREIGLAKLEALLEGGAVSFSAEETIALCELGAELSRGLGHKQKALDFLQRAERTATHAAGPAGAEGGLSERSYQLAEQKLRQEKSKELAAKAGSLWKRKGWSAAAASAAALGSMALFHFMDPLAGLSRGGMDFIGIGLAAVIFWMVNIVADYLVALVMAMLWVLDGLMTPETALSGFASTTWLYMLFILAIGAAITKSGILYRLSLHALRRFPANYRGQLWGLIAGGIALNPLIPSSSAKVTLGVPIARTLSESMGFRDRSAGAAGLSLAAMVFYGFTAPFILTGSYTNAMAFGLVPGAQLPSWFQWFLYALPAFLIFSVLMLLLLKRLFRNPAAARPIARETVDEQLNLLGSWTREERWTVGTVLGSMALLILQPLHGLDNAWIMLLGFGVLLVTGALDTQTLKTSVDWPFLLFIGIAFSFAQGAEQLGIVEAMSAELSERMDAFLSSPTLFLAAVMALSFLVTLVVRDDPAVILLVIALLPLADQAGIHPWVLIFAILLATDPFFFTFQSPTYLLAYYSAEGKSFTHRQGQKVAIGYAVAVIAAVLLSVPYWKWIGLIR
ncbi:SLC13 family permease [Cohnella fermenti]|nr:SLC13 family permease [Cohnella fermenti]